MGGGKMWVRVRLLKGKVERERQGKEKRKEKQW